MALTSMLRLTAESGDIGGINPGLFAWMVGAGVVLVFVLVMAALLAFGRGRDHS